MVKFVPYSDEIIPYLCFGPEDVSKFAKTYQNSSSLF